MKTLKEMAVYLASKQFRIFPIRPGDKTPAIKGWQRFATSNVDKIERRWSQRFANHNLGIATGQGLLVLDCDCKDGRRGLHSLELLDLSGLPTSLRVRTPSGGVHVYLSVPLNTEIHNIVDLDGYPGIDVRAEGGYVVGPGSIIGSRKYEITAGFGTC